MGFTNYTYFSLLGTPLLENTVAISNTATVGTLSLSADTFTYLADPILGLVGTNSPYTFSGSTKQTGFTICKPANTVTGVVAGQGTYAKGIYTLLPANAAVGTIDDLKGKTFDGFEDCGSTSVVSLVFDINANANEVFGTGFGSTITAAQVSSALTSTGLIEGGIVTIRIKVYKVGAKTIMVERGVPLSGFAVGNTNGYMVLWVSR